MINGDWDWYRKKRSGKCHGHTQSHTVAHINPSVTQHPWHAYHWFLHAFNACSCLIACSICLFTHTYILYLCFLLAVLSLFDIGTVVLSAYLIIWLIVGVKRVLSKKFVGRKVCKGLEWGCSRGGQPVLRIIREEALWPILMCCVLLWGSLISSLKCL